MTQFPIKRFGDIAEFINGKAFKPEEWGTVGLPIIRIQNLTGSSNDFNYFDGEIDERYLIKNDDLLISWSASLGVYRWSSDDAVLNQHIFKVNLHDSVDKTFFYYATQTKLREMIGETHGSTMKHITKDRFENLSIAIPPLTIQKQISAILEKADAAREKRGQANQLTEQLLQSAFLEMFGDPVPNPKGWATGVVNDAIEYSEYGTSVKSNEDKRGCLVIGMSNITYDGRIDFSVVRHVELPRNDYDKLKLRRGDVIFNRTNSTELVGKTAFWNSDVDAVVASYLVKLRVTRHFDPIWFSTLLNTQYYKKLFMQRCKKAVGQSNISPTLLKEFPMYKPPLRYQQKFAALVEKVEGLRARQRESEKELENLFGSLMQRAFSGELIQ